MTISFPVRGANCPGCYVPTSERVYLPDDWANGDPIPPGITAHIDELGNTFYMKQGRIERYYCDLG